MDCIQRYAKMLQAKGRPFEVVEDQLFTRSGRWVAPMGPSKHSYRLSLMQCRYLLRKLGGLWVMWTGGFGHDQRKSEWYAVICRQHVPVEAISSRNTRSKLRRGLKYGDVRRVDIREIVEHGYDTYCAALQGYRKCDLAVPSRKEFARRVMSDEPFQDIRHQWAVYHDGRMIAFAQNLVYDTTEVDYTLIKLHPDYLRHYTSYVLIHKMNEYYLQDNGFKYVNDGFRSISHDTGIQDFLIRKFGFEKAYMNLYVYFRPPLGLIIKMARPFRKWLSKANPKLAAVMELDRIAVNR